MSKNLRSVSMRKIREILRLKAGGLGQRQISRSLNISLGAVHKYLKLTRHAGLTWPLPEDMDDKALTTKLLAPRGQQVSKVFTIPDFEWIYKELLHKGVTLQLLHYEYKINHPQDYYSYRRFCEMYQEWKKSKKICLRQEYKGGDKMFVDYAGQTIPITNPQTGEVLQAQIFVAVLGASNYTYSEASWNQQIESWLGSHVRALNYFGGVPALIVPDNLKAGISKACRYEPDINPNYAALVNYYDTAVLPARPYKPQDKAKVENSILVVERWILARLRHKTFYSLSELNEVIHTLLGELNQRSLQKLKGSRSSLFEEVDRPALKPLPQKAFEYAKYYHRKVPSDYHLDIEGHFYSVPYTYIGKQVDLRVTENIIEVLCEGRRIASHPQVRAEGKTTTAVHMPKSHRKHLEWTKEQCLKWAQTIGPSTANMVEKIIATKNHVDQASRCCLGLFRLAKHYSAERLELACIRALYYEVFSYKSIAAILENNLDRVHLQNDMDNTVVPFEHKNIRGSSYYQAAIVKGRELC